jgi:predicted transcriptional regulator
MSAISLDEVAVEVLEDYFDGEDKMEDTPNEVVLASLRAALEDVKAGRVGPIEELFAELDQELEKNDN